MYLSLKDGCFILNQPDETLFSYIYNNTRMILSINDSAENILEKLNGQFTKNKIIEKLEKYYSEPFEKVEPLVDNFLMQLTSADLLLENDFPSKKEIHKGSKEFYTPEQVTIELTHKCPLTCEHCFVNAGVGASMPENDHNDLIDKLLNYGVRNFQLTGGEPFVYKNIYHTIKKLHKYQASIHITTSGYILNNNVKKCLDLISISHDPLVQVSLDGLENTHNSIRGRSNAFEKALNFINHSVEKKIPTDVATILIKQPLHEIEDLTKLVKKMGIRTHHLGIITNQGRAEKNNILGYNHEEYKNVLSYLKEKYDDEHFSLEEIESEENCYKACGAGYKTIKITPMMLVTPCAMMQLNIGNLKKESLETVLIRGYKNFSALGFPQKKYCHDCIEFNYCNNCISEAFIRKNDVEHCTWVLSQEKILTNLTQ